VVVVDGAVVVVVGGGTLQPFTQKTLCLTSAPCDPSAWIVSLTCQPCTGWGVMPAKADVRSYTLVASRPASLPPPELSSSPMKTWGSNSSVWAAPGGVGDCVWNSTLEYRLPLS
jgi:hypothetical protein